MTVDVVEPNDDQSGIMVWIRIMVWISKISPASIGGLIYTVVKQGVAIAVWICACPTVGLIHVEATV